MITAPDNQLWIVNQKVHTWNIYIILFTMLAAKLFVIFAYAVATISGTSLFFSSISIHFRNNFYKIQIGTLCSVQSREWYNLIELFSFR